MTRKFIFRVICPIITVVLLALLICIKIVPTEGVRRNTEQLTIGFIFSLPYDISNTLRAPLAGPLSLILAAGLALIMFLGMIASPIYYIFGYPKRRYFIHDAVKDEDFNNWFVERGIEHGVEVYEAEILVQGNNATRQNATKAESEQIEIVPRFLESVFLLFPTNITKHCQYLMVCHAHGFIRILPTNLVNLYQFFSKKLIEIPEDLRAAILIGLEDQEECSKVFNNCSQDLTSISKKTFAHLVSNVVEIKESVENVF